ncbi:MULTISPECIES: acyl-ACP thioesterase domain-containing protein [Treponema]|uniref:acyl-ACP thioesterase domain-containing protein n=1 Tax=Treponema TaxID=157 RepID=UPI002580118D|nr:acyl-ACP thioesterase domain-containing protein [Treponema sp.]MBQ9102939.1 hypothetical protein [Treponema sp.]
MENKLIYKQPRKVSASFMDCTAKLGLSQVVSMIQDNLTECFGHLNADNYRFNKDYNAFWVFTKTKVHLERRPDWIEVFDAATFPINNAVFRTDVNSIFTDKEGKTLLTANTECCCLDLTKHRPIRLTDTDFPKSDFPAPVFTDKFQRFSFETSEDDFVYSTQVRNQLMDMSNHLNNTEYVKMGIGALQADFIKTHELTDLEVHYLGECKELQTLKVYKKEADGNIYVRITESERVVFEMSLRFAE